MQKAIIYCRVSTKKQENQGESLDNQERECRLYCENNNISVSKVFKETYTGKEKDRPILNDAIKYAKDQSISFFVIFDIDRLSRQGYSVYSELKDELRKSGVQLKDSKNIIRDSTLAVTNESYDLGQYNWNYENGSEMAEMVYSAQSKIEGNKILQRTIPREIELEQKGYHVRASNYGYQNRKLKEGRKSKSIQVKHYLEGDWVIEIFNKRAEGILSDINIVESVNLKGCKKRDGKPMTVKYMQEIIRKPIYAGVIVTKWTGRNPIKTAYEGLVSIDIWNNANRGKRRIIELEDGEINILYKNKGDSKTNDKIEVKEKRKDYNPDYPYSKVLKCPKCGGRLTGNNAKSRNGSIHQYYQCTGKKGIKHKNYSLKKEDVNNTVISIFSGFIVDEDIIKLFESISQEVYKERKTELLNNRELYKFKIDGLIKQKETIIENIDKIINFPTLLEAKNKDLIKIEEEIILLKSKHDSLKEDISMSSFKKHSLDVIKHLDKLVLQKENPDIISLAFDVMFNERMVYEKLSYQTTNNSGLIGLQRQQKNSSEDEFNLNFKWQAH